MNFFQLQVALAFLILVQTILARCPNWCNKRGECTSPQEGGYCLCHYGFTGEDCSQRLCPAGFDPVGLENIPARRTIRLELGHMGGIMMGKYAFGFAGSEVFLPANSNDNDELKCTSALSKLKSVSAVSCKRETFNANTGTASYLISLLSFPEKPYMNNLVHHNGNPGINLFSCNVSKIDHEEASEPFCFVSNADTSTTFPLYAECGNHGVCDRVKGVCACASGFKGDACLDNSDNEDIYDHSHVGPYFTASLVKLSLDAPASTRFNLFQAALNGANVTTIRGDSALLHAGDMVVQGALSLGENELVEGSASAQIRSNVTSGADHMQLYTNSSLAFSVSNGGDTAIAGSLDVLNGSLVVQPRLVSVHNVKVLNDLHIAGSASVEESLMIGSGFALNKEGITVDVATHTGKLFELKSRQAHFNGTLFELSSVGEDSALIKTVTNGLTTFELHSSGFVSMKGLRLQSGGVEVQSGGVQVSAGGISVHGGLTVHSGGLALDNQPYTVGTLHTTNIDTNLHSPVISGASNNVHYAGSLLELSSTGGSDSSGSDAMNFINLLHTTPFISTSNTNTTADANSVFRIQGSGMIDSTSGAVFRGANGIDVYGSMLLRGKVAMQRAVLTPTSGGSVYEVVVPLNATYVVIAPATYTTTSTTTSTTRTNSITLLFEPSPSTHSSGRIVIVSNTDNYTTSGVVHVPPHTTVMLVFDGANWVSVDALKAPMHVLENVRTLTAANDLDLGPHTLSALRFVSASLPSSSVVFSSSGVLSSSDKFTYTKGVLAVPAAKVENLLCNMDARGNDISNAILSNAKLTGASVTATDITVPGLAGLAYFTAKGALQSSTTLSLDPEGRLLVADLYTSIHAHGYSIHNTTIHTANLTDIGVLSANDVYIRSVANSVLYSGGDGKVSSTGSIVIENDIVGVKSLSVGTVVSNVDMTGHTISNTNIVAGSVGASGVSTTTLTVESLAGESNRLVYADTGGVVRTHDASHPIHISTLSVDDIVYSGGTIDFHGRTVKNIVLDTDTFMLGPQKSLVTDELIITSIGSVSSVGISGSGSGGVGGNGVGKSSSSVLVSTASGSVTGSTMYYTHNVLDVGSATKGSVHTNTVVAESVTISSASSGKGGVLSTSGNGTVFSTSSVQLENLAVDKSLTINPTAIVTLAGLEPGALLTLNSKHEVTAVPTAHTKNTNTVDAYLHSVYTDKLHSAVFSGDRVSVQELTLGTGTGTAGGGAGAGGTSGSGVESGAVLVQGKDGKVSPLSEEVLYTSKGVLHVASLLPVKGQNSVQIASALVQHSNVSSSHIHNAHSVETHKLIVKDVAEFFSDVVIDGSVTVHGTVIGSGPYVDSSDARFKTNVTTINGTSALETVNKLRGVSYSFLSSEFPARHLPAAPQIGFLAQEVEAVQPELVLTDAEGYKGVSYSHVSVLLTAAVQELQRKHDKEVGQLRQEVQELKKMVELLMSRV